MTKDEWEVFVFFLTRISKKKATQNKEVIDEIRAEIERLKKDSF